MNKLNYKKRLLKRMSERPDELDDADKLAREHLIDEVKKLQISVRYQEQIIDMGQSPY